MFGETQDTSPTAHPGARHPGVNPGCREKDTKSPLSSLTFHLSLAVDMQEAKELKEGEVGVSEFSATIDS